MISVKTNIKKSKLSFFIAHNQDVCSTAIIQCTCSTLIAYPTVCKVLPEYQSLLNTAIVRLNPRTVSKKSKKSRVYSQTYVFEVSLTTGLQLGDLALELEEIN